MLQYRLKLHVGKEWPSQMGRMQRRTERKSTQTVIRRLFKELPAKVEAMWEEGMRESVQATARSPQRDAEAATPLLSAI